MVLTPKIKTLHDRPTTQTIVVGRVWKSHYNYRWYCVYSSLYIDCRKLSSRWLYYYYHLVYATTTWKLNLCQDWRLMSHQPILKGSMEHHEYMLVQRKAAHLMVQRWKRKICHTVSIWLRLRSNCINANALSDSGRPCPFPSALQMRLRRKQQIQHGLEGNFP